MKIFGLIAFLSVLVLASCQKEIITPSQDSELFDTRGGLRNPNDNDNGCGENSGITDPDNELEEDKVKNRKKKAR